MAASTRISITLVAAVALVALAGCDKARPVAPNQGPDACTLCHGDAQRSEATALLKAAPPATVSGAPAGAHQAHLHASPFRGPVACTDCHPVPTTSGHSNGTVDLVFSPLATAKGTLTPSYASGTCSNVYCHGASLNAGGSNVAPQWTGAEPDCGSCHGYPPSSHAASQTNCAACHPGTVNTDGTINVAGGLHIDGLVEANQAHPAGWADPGSHGHAANSDLASCKQCHGADLAGGTTGVSCDACHASAGHADWRNECNFCHGDRTRAASSASPLAAAPPLGTQGETLASDRAVGAHQAHLTGTIYASAPLACAECHAVPADLDHVDGTPAIAFGAGARRGGAQPAWVNRATCAASYCHGGTLSAGGSVLAPSWTGGPSQAACGACHAIPPTGATHAAVTATTNCSNCHSGYSCTSGNLAACTVDKSLHLDGNVDVTAGCTSCHGSAANPAPPAATSTTNAAVKVGAHQAHLTRSTLRAAPLACAECHVQNTSITHSNGTVDLPWNTLARTGAITPTPGSLNAAAQATWEATPTCTNYCHGAKYGTDAAYAGAATAPRWTDGAATATTCGSCHKAPPSSAAHGAVTSSTPCANCHSGYVCTIATLATCTVDKATHLNGVVDVGGMACNSCHGGAANAAPPVATSTVNAAVKVGAHQAHVVNSRLRSAALPCTECHVANTSTAHTNGVVDLPWGTLAKTGAITPTPGSLNAAAQATWEATPTCTNYCHGAKWAGNAAYLGSAPSPRWTDTAATAAGCGACHQFPPASPSHAGVTATKDCGACHAGYACTTGNQAACTVNKATHLNGALDPLSMSCTSCHGSAANYAPPADTLGGSTGVKVGAHQAHVATARLRTALACTECHTMPTAVTHASGTVDLTWGALARTGAVTPSPGSLGTATSPTQATWESTPTCTNYCHGAKWAAVPSTLGSAPTPRWTDTTATAAACGSCHKSPPATSSHVAVDAATNCNKCHAGYSCTSGNLAACTVNAASHLNGAVDVSALACNSCHGSSVNNAPPAPTSITNSAVKIGAHQAHLTKSTLRTSAVACADCHTVPTSTSHASGTVDLSFTGLARTGGFSPTPASLGGATQSAWELAPTCTNYCHGSAFAFTSAGSTTSPSWTGPAVTCASCHQSPPASAAHAGVTSTKDCGACHAGYACTTANLAACTVNKAAHLNGSVDPITAACNSCHGSAANNAPPSATTTVNAAVKIGAHQAHLTKSNLRTAVLGCGECHTVPTSTSHASGTVDLTWSTLARTGAITPTPGSLNAAAQATWEATPTCTNYCHGAKWAGNAAYLGSAPSPRWTDAAATATTCGSCHLSPPASAAHSSVSPTKDCGSCHAGYACTSGNLAACTVNKTAHLNGSLDPVTMTCTSCHGSATNQAPPSATTTVNAAVKIGAHQAHLTKSSLRPSPVACGECHTVPTSLTHASGTVDLSFTGLARTGGFSPTPGSLGGATQSAWELAPTCTNYCHGSAFAAGSAGSTTSPSWTGPAMTCGSCHGAPPATTDHASVGSGVNCGGCHPGYACTSGNLGACTVNPAIHMDGTLQASAESAGGAACGACHGTILAGMNGTSARASRHLLGGDAAAGAALTWTSPLSGNAAASRTCTNMCHGDHPHDATSPASATHEANVYSDAGSAASRTGTAGTRVVTGGTGTVNRAKTDFDAAATNGGLCVSCHQNQVDATRPAVTKAGFTGAAHNFSSGWQFQLHSGSFDRNCTKCHASAAEGTTPLVAANNSGTSAVHFGDNAFLLAGKLNPAGTAAGFVCYNCHGSAASPANGAQGNRSGKDIQSQIVHATTAGQSGHPANSDSVHDSVAEYNGAAFGNALGGKARHSGCMDCHDTHEARAGTHAQGTNLAGPALQGAWGAQLTSSPAAWTAPASGNFTKKVIAAGTDLEATLCFKCHSGFYGALPTSPSGGYAETDQAQEFNTANVGFHSVLGSNAATSGNTGNLISPWTRSSAMTCTDCHESDVTTDPNGPHGAASKFILKGPNTKWDATVINGSSGMPSGTFCVNCHNANFSGSRFPGHTNGQHNIACFNCHAAIPHGGPRPGMLVAPAGAAAATGSFPGAVANWDTASPYSRPASGNKLYLKSYPASNTTSWSKSNCGCNGTGH